MPSLSEPCPYKYAKEGRHKIRNGLCRNCGAKDEAGPVNHLVVAVNLAEDRFRQASIDYDATFSPGFSDEEKRARLIAWRSALQHLLAAEKETP